VDSAYATLNSTVVLLRPYKAKYLQQAVRVRDIVTFSHERGGASLRVLGVTDLKNPPNGVVDVYAPISGVIIIEQNVTNGAGVKTLDSRANRWPQTPWCSNSLQSSNKSLTDNELKGNRK
jgi:hypothetical protein